MSTIDRTRTTRRSAWALAVACSCALHASALVVVGALPSSRSVRDKPAGGESEFVFELRLGVARDESQASESALYSASTSRVVPEEYLTDSFDLEQPVRDPWLEYVSSPVESVPQDEPAEPKERVSDDASKAPDEPLTAPAEKHTSDSGSSAPSTPPLEPSRLPPSSAKPVSPRDAPSVAAGATKAAVLLENPRPRYPTESRRRGEQGEVICLLHIGIDGKVTKVELVTSSGFKRLDRAALEGLERWSFQPATENGLAVTSKLRHKVTFVVE